MSRTVRPYTPADREGCLAVFDSNVDPFFLAEERGEYAAFLGQVERGELGGAYFVVEEGGATVACGGVGRNRDGAAGLWWGMARRDLHGRGLGRALLEARLGWLREHLSDIRELRLDTSQHTAAYYARRGFRKASVTKDAYGPGLDRHDMVLDLGAR